MDADELIQPKELIKKVETLEATVRQLHEELAKVRGGSQDLARALFLIVTNQDRAKDRESEAYDYYLKAAQALFPPENR